MLSNCSPRPDQTATTPRSHQTVWCRNWSDSATTSAFAAKWTTWSYCGSKSMLKEPTYGNWKFGKKVKIPQRPSVFNTVEIVEIHKYCTRERMTIVEIHKYCTRERMLLFVAVVDKWQMVAYKLCRQVHVANCNWHASTNPRIHFYNCRLRAFRCIYFLKRPFVNETSYCVCPSSLHFRATDTT